MSTKHRVRFCPSPSSSGKAGMHLGNAKTALFNYLFAKKNNADFIFRIEDTDQARVGEDSAKNILADLQWLGIMPNVGFGTGNKQTEFYTQMERLDSYKKVADELLANGLAYKCYCTQEELDLKRKEAEEKNPKAPFKYPGTCRNVPQDQNKDYVIRFKAPTEGHLEFEDVTFGKRKIPNKENYDFVILRQNGIPLYNFAVVVDDGITDKITHVIRGSDHVKNMPQQILLYQALGLAVPAFSHLSMLMGPNGKLSKRDGSVSIVEYKEKGYSPIAVLNYLVRFGWSFENQEIFTMEDMVSKFNLEDCHSKDGTFDFKKFELINYTHLKSETLTPNDLYLKHLKPFLGEVSVSDDYLISLIHLVRPRSRTFLEAADFMKPLLKKAEASKELIEKNLTPANKEYLKGLTELLAIQEEWNEVSLRSKANDFFVDHKTSLKELGGTLRLALLGTANSPEIFQVLSALGKKDSISRLEETISSLS